MQVRGKTTLAAGLASDLGVPHVELDGLYHGPGWTPADPDMFRTQVRLATAEPAWVIDGNYTSIVGQILPDRAGLVIALDLPRWRVMARITHRTHGCMITRAELWNGNPRTVAQPADPRPRNQHRAPGLDPATWTVQDQAAADSMRDD